MSHAICDASDISTLQNIFQAIPVDPRGDGRASHPRRAWSEKGG